MAKPFRDVSVYVFSFNRGNALDKCLSSVALNVPGARVTVFDDRSTDRTTLKVLEAWQGSVNVVRRGAREVDGRVGGLHANMNRAFRDAADRGNRYALMLQDDMQVVRRVSPIRDLENFDLYFEANPDSVELSVSFWAFNRTGINDDWRVDRSGMASFALTERYQSAYLDTGLFHVPRFLDVWGTLERGEGENALTARRLGLVKGWYRFPFTMFMPFPITHRNRRRSPRIVLSELLARSGVHPFRYMTTSEVAELLARRDSALPSAREWLSCPTVDDRGVWSYYGGPRDLRAVTGWRSRVGAFLGGSAPQIDERHW